MVAAESGSPFRDAARFYSLTMLIFKGQPIVSGLAFGRARIVAPARREVLGKHERSGTTEEEEQRLKKAVERLSTRLEKMCRVATERMGEAEAQIFLVHQQMLTDPAFEEGILDRIRNGEDSAEDAIRSATDKLGEAYSRAPEEKIRHMASELASLSEDLLEELDGGPGRPIGKALEPVVLFVEEVTPRAVMRAEAEGVVGFVARSASLAAHATILTRALEIPLVANIRDGFEGVNDGDRVVLDGTAGTIVVNPNEEKERIYQELRRRLRHARLDLLTNRELPSVTLDGCAVSLQANISMSAEVEAIERCGGDGVGLYRTELSYILRNRYPTEEELNVIYRNLAERLSPLPLTVRTIDAGGDKVPAYFRLRRSRNPLLGLRGMRLLSTHREVLQTQFRAILRASAAGNIRILFPLIGSLEEWDAARDALEEAKETLRSAGEAFQEDVPVGLMIELPSAALSVRALLARADFASIGTNDLVQCLFGVDRTEGQVAHLFHPVSPPVLELIHRVSTAGRKLGKPVSLCGEMGADPRLTELLIGLGLRSLSMNAEAIPAVKDRVRSAKIAECEELARKAMAETSLAGIEDLLNQ